MSSFVKDSFHRYFALCLLVAVTGGAAHAGIFHHKNKPLSQKDDALASVTSNQPDKELFDRSMKALKKGKFDIARLDLQTLLNTYPDSEYAMRAKLAIGDTWYKEGGTAALQQAEEEYKDFITFFPDKPEAAEAQMKVADIYYKQMQKPDRDPTNAVRAQEEYRAMILQYPDSSLIPQAKQQLREVQEVLGDHEFTIGSFYQTQMNYAASIARLQSIIDTYPLYSRTDEALLQVGDAYAAQARNVGRMRLDAGAKDRLLKLYNGRAVQAYDRVILEYPMATHADDARDRLEAMNRPVPEPTNQEMADSAAIEQSRAPINLKYKTIILITSRPSVVQASRVGEPSLVDPTQIMAPAVVKGSIADVQWALKPDGKAAPEIPGGSNNLATIAANAGNAATNPATAAAGSSGATTGTNGLQMNDMSGNADVTGAVVNSNGADTGAPANAVEPPVGSGPGNEDPTQPATPPPATATGQPTVWPSATHDNGGLPTVAPADTTPLPATARAAAAPAQVNDVTSSGHGANTVDQNTKATGKHKKKNPKPKFTQGEESSSTHKKKKGLHKLF
jgi:outer membrane protein assembly factor BamD